LALKEAEPKTKAGNKPEAPVKPEKPKETTPEFIASMASVLVVGLFIITFCLQAFEIPTSSMETTLLIGDHLFVDRVTPAPKSSWMPLVPYRNLKRGDIIVFISPAQPGLYLVKRVIGIPGDHIHLQEGVVYRNGQKLDEPYNRHNPASEVNYRDNFPSVPPIDVGATPEWQLVLPQNIENGEVVVPPDRYFAMGDNRDVSFDSRYWGFVPRENIIGRPMFVYWSFETPPNQYEKTSIGDRLSFIGHIVIHFFDQTRWSRMFRLVR
jgi:signal peptidase I